MPPTKPQCVRWPEIEAIARRAVATASGIVLEVGAGRGDNFAHFAAGVTWIGLEPHTASRRALQQAAAAAGHHHDVLDARCESIPLEDGSVDSIVGTFVMCSVDDVAASLAEFRRVLAPGGRLVLVDHVAAPVGTGTRMLQNLVSPVSRRVDKGCRYNREVTGDLRAAGFTDLSVEEYLTAVFPGVAVPCAVHNARAPAQ